MAPVRAENFTVMINASGLGSGASGTVINFMGTNVAVSQLPRQFSVANGTNATYAWQQYVTVNSTYRFVFVNASKTTVVVSCMPSIPPNPPICLYLPFTTNITQTGTVLITTNASMMAYYSPEVYLQYVAPTGGSANLTSGWYVPGTILGISATPNSGYNFDGWTTTGSISVQNSSASVTTLTINGPGTVTAKFAAAPPPPSGFPMEYIILIVAIVAVLGIAGAFLMRRKPKPPPAPRPVALKLTPEKKEIFADGRSSTEIAVELVDGEGKPVASEMEREVRLSATDGTIQQSVTIPKGASSAKATLSSSIRVGQVSLTASSKDLASAQASVSFIEKKRYCMICGKRMPIDARVCPSCGSAPPSGADTKVCPNCGAVIPIVAKFCRECGASQPA
ncbi:MAG: zinc-ribbon domain-containing protein [Candidatus Methanosuratincola sp.]|nr:zinc-ribbon domain-containing protein [Candidatus Methanosuratincola sp.]